MNYRVSLRQNTQHRSSRSTTAKSIQPLFRATVAQATGVRGSWTRLKHNRKSGWVPTKFLVKTTAKINSPGVTGGKEVEIKTKYTSNRAGLTDRYWTNRQIRLYTVAGRVTRIADVPKNAVVYRDLKFEKIGGQLPGWYFVRTQGTWGWVQSAYLQRTSTAPTSNSRGITAAQVKQQTNGRLPASMLVAVPWDREKTLIAAPALADVTRLNEAFKQRLGHNLDLDLIYRTRGTQELSGAWAVYRGETGDLGARLRHGDRRSGVDQIQLRVSSIQVVESQFPQIQLDPPETLGEGVSLRRVLAFRVRRQVASRVPKKASYPARLDGLENDSQRKRAPCRIRTGDLLFTRQLLWPAELRRLGALATPPS